MKGKKLTIVLSMAVLFIGLNAGQIQALEFITLGTSNPAGTWYHIGNGICKVLNDLNPGWKMAPEATAGGTENLRKVASGDLDVGMVHVTDILRDIKAKNVSPDSFRLMMAAHVSIAHFVVLKDSHYNSLDEIMVPDVKIGVGEPGSAIQGISKLFLSVFDLDFDKVKAAQLSQGEQVNAIKDGVIEVATLGSGLPVPSAMDLATTRGIKIIPIPDDVIAKLRTKSPVWVKYIIPANAYPGLSEAIPTFGIPAYLIVKKDMDDDTAYKIVKGIIENNQEIAKVHRAGLEYNQEKAFNYMDILVKMNMQFHPGVVKYYKEKGLWKY